MKTAFLTSIVSILLLTSAAAAPGDSTAIVGGKIVIGDGTVIDGGTVVISGDRIVTVSADPDVPSSATIIDATGKEVWPGLIDPYTTLGLVEVSSDRMNNDANERTSTNTAQLRALDGINPDAEPIAVTRIAGVTTVLVSPGDRNPINGQALVINLLGRSVDDMVVGGAEALVVNFSSTRDGKYPSTRPGTVAMIRQTLYDAKAYGEAKKAPKKDKDDADSDRKETQKTDLANETLLRALSGELPVVARAPQARDIRNALAVAKEFDLDLILYDTREAWKVLEDIKAAKVPVLLKNTFDQPSDREQYDRYYALAGLLAENGIEFAFTTGSNHNVRQLPDHAAMAITYGLDEETAMRAVALNSAGIFGIDESHGSLTEGKVANVVIWDGSPFDLRSKPTAVFIDGEEIKLESRQERLRDRFTELE
ncbi:MAG: amidohydrolase family protein [bacterium]|nr:amidohydrolase family protein [bacterium]